MKKHLLPIAIILFMVALVACQSKSSVSVTAAGNAILQHGRWKLSSGTITLKTPAGRDTTLNYMTYLPKCYANNYFKFDSNYVGYLYSLDTPRCNLAQGDSVMFDWKLTNNNTYMDIYNGFYLFDSIVETINPYHFDTIPVTGGGYRFDTLKYNDTTGFTELDTIWTVQFDSAMTYITNINNASLINLNSSSFTLNFYVLGYYPDSTKWHELNPILRQDTFKYSLSYTNF